MKRKLKEKSKKKEKAPQPPIEEEKESEVEELEEVSGESEEENIAEEETKEFAQRSVYHSHDLDEITQKLQDQFYNRLNSKKLIKRQGKVPFVEHCSIYNPGIVVLPENDAVHKDLKRELWFYNLTIQDAKKGIETLMQSGVKIGRPDDFFAEMMKSDEQMKKIKAKLLKQEEKIKQFEEKKLRIDNKKFRNLIIYLISFRS